MELEIRKGLLYNNGKQVNYKATPNKSGSMIPTAIVVHDTASGLNTDGPVSWLCNPAAKASAHFVLGRGGIDANDIWQLAPTNIKTWHAGKSRLNGVANVNNFSIGIEIVNPGWCTSKDGGKNISFSRGTPSWDGERYGAQKVTDDAHPGNYWWMAYTNEQIESVVMMCRAFVDAYPSIKVIVPHWLISPGRKVDTNPLFPLDRVRSLVFTNRGPVEKKPEPTKEEQIVPKDVAPAAKEKDALNEEDAKTTVDLNIRPWPDSPKRFGVIKKGAKVDIERQSVSQSNGEVWFLVNVNPSDINADKGSKKDGDGKYRGFVHSKYLELLD